MRIKSEDDVAEAAMVWYRKREKSGRITIMACIGTLLGIGQRKGLMSYVEHKYAATFFRP